jgi:hypothetical protein
METTPLTIAEHLYPNAGTPKFWGSRICGLVSRAEIDALFGVDEPVDRNDQTLDSDRRLTDSYNGDSHETWSRTDCGWGFGSITVFEGAWQTQQKPLGPIELRQKDRPENAIGLCEPEPGVETNGWCERLRVVSINGKDVKLFDSFDVNLLEPIHTDSEASASASAAHSTAMAYLSVAFGTKTVEAIIRDSRYRDPKKIAAFIELLTARIASLQPATPAQQNPKVSSLRELTESQWCSVLTDETIEELLGGKAKTQSASWQNWADATGRTFACIWGREAASVQVAVTSRDAYQPLEVFETRGRKAVVEAQRGVLILPDDQALTIEFSRIDSDNAGKQLIKSALTRAVAQLETFGALAPIPSETTDSAGTTPPPLSATPEVLPVPGTSGFPGETICGLLTDVDFALASGTPEQPIASSNLYYEGTATTGGFSTTCKRKFNQESPIPYGEFPKIVWAVSSGISGGLLIKEPLCAGPTGCYRNKATIYTPTENNDDTEVVGYTAVLPDGRYIEMIVQNFTYKTVNDLTALGERLTKRVAELQFVETATAPPTLRGDQSELQLCALINDGLSQYWLGGTTEKIVVGRDAYSKIQLPEWEELSGSVELSCRKTRNDISISVSTDCPGSESTRNPVALFSVGKFRVLLTGGDDTVGGIQLNGETQLCVKVTRDVEPMGNTKEQQAAFKAMMTAIATQLDHR